MPPKAYQTRKMSFSACHRLHSISLTDEENIKLYGKCNHKNGHGHNYTVEVTLYGAINPDTGMILNMTVLKKYMEIAIMEPLDHRNIDKDVEYFKTKPSTTENVAIFIWDHLKEIMDCPELLHEVKIHETENNIVAYRGD
ncbi:6-pyruvoyl tetrahydrobiopterin synthase [Agrilus planipennis]|uniref:6-pyruvoyltetrahydropterin synthase n=1 Tax=Agrilus planipennis TaxID=224129 RepID=A0A1W4X9S5_AGRPL|nr:6-pyruvoyl tetrahydrobiopterin synthase [Agrilus planipennis]